MYYWLYLTTRIVILTRSRLRLRKIFGMNLEVDECLLVASVCLGFLITMRFYIFFLGTSPKFVNDASTSLGMKRICFSRLSGGLDHLGQNQTIPSTGTGDSRVAPFCSESAATSRLTWTKAGSPHQFGAQGWRANHRHSIWSCISQINQEELGLGWFN